MFKSLVRLGKCKGYKVFLLLPIVMSSCHSSLGSQEEEIEIIVLQVRMRGEGAAGHVPLVEEVTCS